MARFCIGNAFPEWSLRENIAYFPDIKILSDPQGAIVEKGEKLNTRATRNNNKKKKTRREKKKRRSVFCEARYKG